MSSSSVSSSADTRSTSSGRNKFFQLFKFGDTESNRKIFDDTVLNREDRHTTSNHRRDSLTDAQADLAAPKEDSKDLWGLIAGLMTGSGSDNSGDDGCANQIQGIISRASQSSGEMSSTESTVAVMEMKDTLETIMTQMKGAFGDVPLDKIDPIAFNYYLEAEEAKKNPSWKRRLHRFMPGIKMETVYGLNDALYLAQLAYEDTVEDVQRGLKDYKGADFELVYCTTEGKPRMPAHFLAIKRDGTSPSRKSNSPFFNGDDYVDLILSVRGTKTLEDMLSDALLEETDYRGGKSHEGVCLSGLFIAQQNKELLLRILEMSGRKKLHLTLLGHSLGAGAAAIACIELNEEPNIEAYCIGFGCPALLNKDMSVKWKNKITTIISDADCVARMSGATIANMLMDVLEFDGSDLVMEDVHQVRAIFVLPLFL
jgi:Lipase (class 3)